MSKRRANNNPKVLRGLPDWHSFCKAVLTSVCVLLVLQVAQVLGYESVRKKGVARVLDATDYGAKCDGFLPDSSTVNTRAHDDTRALQVFFDVVATSGARGRIPSEKRCEARRLKVPSHLHLTVDGSLFQIANANSDFLSTAGAPERTSDVFIDGSGTIDGNRSHQAPNASKSPGACLNMDAVDGLTIGPVIVQECAKFAANITNYSSKIILKGTTFKQSGNSAEFAVGCRYCWAFDISVSSITDFGFAFYQGCLHCGIIGGHFDHNATGIGVLTDDQNLPMSEDVQIIGPSSSFNDGPGVYVWNNPNGSKADGRQHRHVSIMNWHGDHNDQDKSGDNGSAYFGGIRLANCDRCVVSDGSENDDGGRPADISPCIFLAPGVTSPVISGNRCRNEGSGGGDGMGIVVSNETLDPLIIGNSIEDIQTIPTTRFALSGGIGFGSHGVVAHNRFVGKFLGRPENIVYGENIIHVDNEVHIIEASPRN